MANHLSRQIRDAIVTLVTGLSTTGSRVLAEEPKQVPASPCLIVHEGHEDSPEVLTQGRPRLLQRRQDIVIKALAKGAGVNNTLSAIRKEVEIAIAGNPTLSGLAKQVDLGPTDIDYSFDTDQPTGALTLTYTVTYHVKENAPDVAL